MFSSPPLTHRRPSTAPSATALRTTTPATCETFHVIKSGFPDGTVLSDGTALQGGHGLLVPWRPVSFPSLFRSAVGVAATTRMLSHSGRPEDRGLRELSTQPIAGPQAPPPAQRSSRPRAPDHHRALGRDLRGAKHQLHHRPSTVSSGAALLKSETARMLADAALPKDLSLTS